MILLIILIAVTSIFVAFIISDLLTGLIDEWKEQKRQRYDCNYCCYFKDGKCKSVFETLCKQNNKMMWNKDENKSKNG